MAVPCKSTPLGRRASWKIYQLICAQEMPGNGVALSCADEQMFG
jgi:hypothetical protein